MKKFNNPIVYFFAKNNDVVETKKCYAKAFLLNNNLKESKVVFDTYKYNYLKYKTNLNKLLLLKDNFDLCILSLNDLGRETEEILDIIKLSKYKNIRIFDIQHNDFIDMDYHLMFNDIKKEILKERRGSICKGNLELY